MDVRVAHVVFLPICRVAAVLCCELVLVVGLTKTVAPVLNHLLLLVLNHYKQQERLIQVPHKAYPYKTDAVLLVEWV